MTREERHIAVLSRLLENIDVYDSVQPTEERKKAIKAAIQALSQEPCERFEWGIDGNVYKITKAKDGKEICQQVCEDAISRDWIKTAIHNFYYGLKHTPSEEDIQAYIDVAPSVTQKSGKWSHDGSHWKNRFICSECGYKLFDEPTNYCPNCGARMFEP